MASDHAAKKTALEARLKMLDADAARVAEKRKATEGQLAGLGKKVEASATPKAKRGSKK